MEKIFESNKARFLLADATWLIPYFISLGIGASGPVSLSIASYIFLLVVLLVFGGLERLIYRGRWHVASPAVPRRQRIAWQALTLIMIVVGTRISISTGSIGVGLASMELGLLAVGTATIMLRMAGMGTPRRTTA